MEDYIGTIGDRITADVKMVSIYTHRAREFA